MDAALLTQDDYDALPPDSEPRFLALEELCRGRMLEKITDDTEPRYDETIRVQYMTTVAAAAEELGMEALFFPSPGDDIQPQLQSFLMDVTRLTTRLRLRNSSRSNPHSVQLANRTRALINREVDRLADMIESSDLPAMKKKALHAKLDELRGEIDKERIRYGKVFACLAVVGASVVGGGTSFLADAPNALATITSLIGADKEAENEVQSRLEGKRQKALPAPERSAPVFEPSGMDDDIPF